MTVHQRFGPPAYEFHPELGYLCPSRQLRQNVRVGLAAAAFGLVAGVAGAIMLLPRHDLAQSEPMVAVAPVGQVKESTPLPASSPSIASPIGSRGTPASAGGISVDGVAKQQPPPTAPTVPTSPGVEAPNAAPAAVEAPAAPAVARKSTRIAHSVARRRAREPAPPNTFATSPFGFQTGRFAGEANSNRRQDWNGGWRW
jgi:hypothetical protein